jgi:hypothetical protein
MTAHLQTVVKKVVRELRHLRSPARTSAKVARCGSFRCGSFRCGSFRCGSLRPGLNS